MSNIPAVLQYECVSISAMSVPHLAVVGGPVSVVSSCGIDLGIFGSVRQLHGRELINSTLKQ